MTGRVPSEGLSEKPVSEPRRHLHDEEQHFRSGHNKEKARIKDGPESRMTP